MKQRINFEAGQGALKAMLGLHAHLAKSGPEKSLLELVYFRVSQINGCAYCVDSHSKDLRAAGETEQRVYSLVAWRETPYYTERERAAFALTEAITLIAGGVPEDVYAEAERHFEPAELSALIWAIVTINAWNRLAIPTGDPVPG